MKGLEDKNLKDFWSNEIGKAGDIQKVKMAIGITNGRFLFSASARRMLEQLKSTINFEDILVGKKILICNFSKGLLGEDTSALFGTTVLAKIQTAALRRARIGQSDRSPYYLYVDEPKLLRNRVCANVIRGSQVQVIPDDGRTVYFTARRANCLVDIILMNGYGRMFPIW